MKILITGAGGFIGQLLAAYLLNDGHSLILTDVFDPPIPDNAKNKNKASTLKVDLCSATDSILSPDLDAIYSLHSVMSAVSEAKFELGYRVNLYASLNLLDAARRVCPGVRFIYASTFAVYGQPIPSIISESTVPTPQGSYGAQKMMVEYAINDYTRRGYINGFSLRVPAISSRPGKPSSSSVAGWTSGMIREPLLGQESVVPCPDDFELWFCSPRILIKNLEIALHLPRECLPLHNRQLNLPGITVKVEQMINSLREVGGEEAVKLIKRVPAPPEAQALLDSWPTRFDISKALSIGMVADQSFTKTVEDFAISLKT